MNVTIWNENVHERTEEAVRSIYPGMGFSILVESFIVVVIGGLGSIGGAFVGALLIGFVRAFGAVAFGAGSRRLHQIGVERPHMVAALVEMSGGALVPVPGGVLIRDKAGTLVGAVGVSGDTSDNDETAAVAGIEAAGFAAETGG